MANNSTRSAKTKVIHAGVLLADPDIQPKSEQSILIEGERIKAVSGGFIDPPPGGELIDLRKKFVLPGLIDCHVHLTAQRGEHVLQGGLHYQACDSNSCLPPHTIPVTVTVAAQ